MKARSHSRRFTQVATEDAQDLLISANENSQFDRDLQEALEYFVNSAPKRVHIANSRKIETLPDETLLVATMNAVYHVVSQSEIVMIRSFDEQISSLTVLKNTSVVAFHSGKIEAIALQRTMGICPTYDGPEQPRSMVRLSRKTIGIWTPTVCYTLQLRKGKFDELDSNVLVEETDDVRLSSHFVLILRQHDWLIKDWDDRVLHYSEEAPTTACICPSEHQFAVLCGETVKIYSIPSLTVQKKFEVFPANLENLLQIEFIKGQALVGVYKTGACAVFEPRGSMQILKFAQTNANICYATTNQDTNTLYCCGQEKVHIVSMLKRLDTLYTSQERIFLVREYGCNGGVFAVKELDGEYFIAEYDVNCNETHTYPMPNIKHLVDVQYSAYVGGYLIGAMKRGQFTLYLWIVGEEAREVCSKVTSGHSHKLLVTSEYVVIYTGDRLLVLEFPELTEYTSIGASTNLNAILYQPEMNSLIFDHYNSVYVYNVKNDHQGAIKHVSSSGIRQLCCDPNNIHLYAGCADGSIVVLNLKQSLVVVRLEIHTGPVTYLAFSENFLYSLDVNGELCSCDLTIRAVTFKEGGFKFGLLVTEDTTLFVQYDEHSITLRRNLLKSNSVAVTRVKEVYLFAEYVSKLFRGSRSLPRDQEFNAALIFPYLFKPLHFYAYLGLGRQLKQALLVDPNLTNTSTGENALTIAVKRQFMGEAEVLMRHIIEDYDIKANPALLRMINLKTLLALNSFQSPSLRELYDKFVREAPNKQLPAFISTAFKLPKYKESGTMLIAKNSFDLPKERGKHLQEVAFYETLVKLNYTIGSEDSYNFLTSLQETPNKEIIDSQFIHILLRYKWLRLRKFMRWSAVVYCLYLLMLIFYMIEEDGSSDGLPKSVALPICFILNIGLFGFEVFQLNQNWSDYFKSPRKCLELLRQAIFILFCIAVWLGAELYYLKLPFLVVLLLSLLRGISYFRVFATTRHLVNSLKVVFSSSIAFLILYTYTTVSSGLLLYHVHRDDPVYQTIANSYTLSLGDFDTSNFDLVDWSLFLVITLVNPILMLNVLIAIMSDAFANVQGNKAIANNLEIIEMIKEIESFYFVNWDDHEDEFLQACLLKSHSEESGLEDQVAALQETVNQLKQDICSLQDAQEARAERSERQHEELLALLQSQILTN